MAEHGEPAATTPVLHTAVPVLGWHHRQKSQYPSSAQVIS